MRTGHRMCGLCTLSVTEYSYLVSSERSSRRCNCANKNSGTILEAARE